jgi:hypothetical protein
VKQEKDQGKLKVNRVRRNDAAGELAALIPQGKFSSRRRFPEEFHLPFVWSSIGRMPRLHVVPRWTLVSVEGKCKGPRFSEGLVVEFIAVD